jgi:glutamate-1-semialdehyde 2,1-aminomutase
VSSTFGGDTLALAAARATIDEYRRQPVVEHLWTAGRRFQEGVRAAATRTGVTADCIGYPVHPKIVILHRSDEDQRLLMSLFLQETARHGCLFHFAGFNTSLSHRDDDVDRSVDVCEAAFRVVGAAVADGKIADRLEGKPYEVAFRRS